jgi:hypothetical protein
MGILLTRTLKFSGCSGLNGDASVRSTDQLNVKTHVKNFQNPSPNRERPMRYGNRRLDQINQQIGNSGIKIGKTSLRNIWWVPMRSGLVRDISGKHYKAIKNAIWLYLFLLSAANHVSGKLFMRIDTIARETSFSTRSVNRWLRILREKGYIRTHSNGRSLDISIEKWRPISRK